MKDVRSLDLSSLKAFQNKSQVGCFVCYILVIKRMKFITNLVC